jgi:hypothetical protein
MEAYPGKNALLGAYLFTFLSKKMLVTIRIRNLQMPACGSGLNPVNLVRNTGFKTTQDDNSIRINEAKTIVKILVLYIREGNKGQMKTTNIVKCTYLAGGAS